MIVFSEDAESDLDEISDYTKEIWGERQERKYMSEMWDRFLEIRANPERFAKRDEIFAGCRISHYGQHVILFYVTDGIVEIARVLHHKMDIEKRFQ